MKEAELKLAVGEYLQIKTNQGEIYADRLNSGEVIEVRGNSRRRVKLCRAGTADFFFIKLSYAPNGMRYIRVVYLECKSILGFQSPEQGAFQKLVEAQGAEYHVVRDVDEVIKVVEGDL